MMNRLILLAPLVLAGCGYTFQGAGSVLPPDVKIVYVEAVENESSEPGLSRLLTDALRDRFDRFGTVVVADAPGEADALLSTKVKSVDRDTQTSTSATDAALQTRIKVSLSSELRRSDGEVLWKNPNMVISKLSGAASGAVVTSSTSFLGGSLSAGDLGRLGTREVQRLEGEQALSAVADDAAAAIYTAAVLPDF